MEERHRTRIAAFAGMTDAGAPGNTARTRQLSTIGLVSSLRGVSPSLYGGLTPFRACLMSSRFAAFVTRWSASRRRRASELLRRLAFFAVVWSGLLFIHESGHAWVATRQGRAIQNVQIGLGPTIWRGELAGTDLQFRLIPVAGLTRVATDPSAPPSLASEGAMFGAGIVTTAVFAILIAVFVGGWEQGVGRRCVWGRMIVADAVVLTVFNFLPVPPLDGGRAVLAAITALRGTPLSSDALFWTHLGGFALAILPMMAWTRWTRRIDTVAMWWKAPRAWDQLQPHHETSRER